MENVRCTGFLADVDPALIALTRGRIAPALEGVAERLRVGGVGVEGLVVEAVHVESLVDLRLGRQADAVVEEGSEVAHDEVLGSCDVGQHRGGILDSDLPLALSEWAVDYCVIFGGVSVAAHEI